MSKDQETAIAKKDQFVTKGDVLKIVDYAVKETGSALSKMGASVNGGRTPNDLKLWGEMIVAGELFPRGDKALPPAVKVARAGIKIVAGDSYGINEVESQSLFHIVDGTIKPDYKLRLMQIKKSEAYDYRFIEATDKKVELEILKHGKPIGSVVWDEARVKTAKLDNKDNHKKFPKTMKIARSAHEAFYLYCGDLLTTADENYRDTEPAFDEEADPALLEAPESVLSEEFDNEVSIDEKEALAGTSEPRGGDMGHSGESYGLAEFDAVDENAEKGEPEPTPLESFLELARVKFPNEDGELDSDAYEGFLAGADPEKADADGLAELTEKLRSI